MGKGCGGSHVGSWGHELEPGSRAWSRGHEMERAERAEGGESGHGKGAWGDEPCGIMGP